MLSMFGVTSGAKRKPQNLEAQRLERDMIGF